jgi:hypothetical protein
MNEKSDNPVGYYIEAFFFILNNLFIASHPYIYNFIDVLNNIQSETYIKVRSNRQRKSGQIDEK